MEIDVPLIEDLERVLEHEGTDHERWEWRIKGTDLCHHPSEPAAQHKNGYWVWCWMDRVHRWDGPAALWDGKFSYWIQGKQLTKEEWEKHPLRVEWLRYQATSI